MLVTAERTAGQDRRMYTGTRERACVVVMLHYRNVQGYGEKQLSLEVVDWSLRNKR